MDFNGDTLDIDAGDTLLRSSDPDISTSLGAFQRRLQNFDHHANVEDLTPLISGTRAFERDHPAWAERGDLANLFVLETGWAYKFRILHGGRRHISEFFGPGAICNWSRLSDFEEQGDILFKAGAKVSMLDASALDTVLQEQPGLGAVVRRHEIARTMRTAQRVRSVISSPATEKLLTLILDLDNEARAIGRDPIWIVLPFSQIEIADILGLTPVHVSRTFAKLEEEGVFSRDGRHLRLRGAEGLRKSLGYKCFLSSHPLE